jgi:hypothetical protein
MSNGINDKAFDLMTASADKTDVDLTVLSKLDAPEKFDPEGSGYDKKTAHELMELFPLTMKMPERKGKYDRETLSNEDAFQAWVWHEDENSWEKHGGSLDPRTGMVLKGMAKDSYPGDEAYNSMRLMVKEEERRANEIVYDPFKERYFSSDAGSINPLFRMSDIINEKRWTSKFLERDESKKTVLDKIRNQ